MCSVCVALFNVACFAKGFASMKIGEKAILKCRSDYAYGDNPQPVRYAWKHGSILIG